MKFDIPNLIGSVVDDIQQNTETLTIKLQDGRTYLFGHEQECCEKVYLADMNGDINDLIGQTITIAHFSESPDKKSTTAWTFVHLSSPKGSLVIRWNADTDTQYSTDVCIRVTYPTPEHSGISLRPQYSIYQRRENYQYVATDHFIHTDPNYPGWIIYDHYNIHGTTPIQGKEPDQYIYGPTTYAQHYPNNPPYHAPWSHGIEYMIQLDPQGHIVPHEGHISLFGQRYIIDSDGTLILPD